MERTAERQRERERGGGGGKIEHKDGPTADSRDERD